jgi:hypothetical protein
MSTVEVRQSSDGIHRILVLAHEGFGGRGLAGLIDEHEPDKGAEVFIVVPALSGSVKQLANDDREEIAAAQADLDRRVAADEVVIVNPEGSEMEGLEEASTERALKDVPLPVVVLTVA